jgi:hypothetical protein
MDSDERQVTDYLKSWPRHYVSAREIARRAAGKRRFRDEPQWAFPVISRLLEQELIETDGLGHYRIRQQLVESRKRRRWISPHLRRILERSGRDFSEVLEIPEEIRDSPED